MRCQGKDADGVPLLGAGGSHRIASVSPGQEGGGWVEAGECREKECEDFWHWSREGVSAGMAKVGEGREGFSEKDLYFSTCFDSAGAVTSTSEHCPRA